jgi:hypothetical protein
MKRIIIFLIALLLSSCNSHYYRPVIHGVIYDINTCKPIYNAEIRFIHDLETLEQGKQLNKDELYYSEKFGKFKIKQIKGHYYYKSEYLMSLSWVFRVSHESYIADTVNLRNLNLKLDKIYLDTIWLKSSFIK